MASTPATPLRRWLLANARKRYSTKPDSISALARRLRVSRNRAQFWVKGECLPQGLILEKLLALTRLPLKQLLPSHELREKRRLREQRRRNAQLYKRVRRGQRRA